MPQFIAGHQEDLLGQVLGIGNRPGKPVGVPIYRLMVVGNKLVDIHVFAEAGRSRPPS